MKRSKLDKFTDSIILASGSAYGKYQMEMVAEQFGKPINFEEIKDDWFSMYTKNENIEWYYDSQWNIIQNAIWEINGKQYRLESNEDLWFVPVDMEVPEEWMI